MIQDKPLIPQTPAANLQNSAENSMSRIPIDVLQQCIFTRLDFQSLSSAANVSKQWRAIVQKTIPRIILADGMRFIRYLQAISSSEITDKISSQLELLKKDLSTCKNVKEMNTTYLTHQEKMINIIKLDKNVPNVKVPCSKEGFENVLLAASVYRRIDDFKNDMFYHQWRGLASSIVEKLVEIGFINKGIEFSEQLDNILMKLMLALLAKENLTYTDCKQVLKVVQKLSKPLQPGWLGHIAASISKKVGEVTKENISCASFVQSLVEFLEQSKNYPFLERMDFVKEIQNALKVAIPKLDLHSQPITLNELQSLSSLKINKLVLKQQGWLNWKGFNKNEVQQAEKMFPKGTITWV
jgi:hypothetical protein